MKPPFPLSAEVMTEKPNKQCAVALPLGLWALSHVEQHTDHMYAWVDQHSAGNIYVLNKTRWNIWFLFRDSPSFCQPETLLFSLLTLREKIDGVTSWDTYILRQFWCLWIFSEMEAINIGAYVLWQTGSAVSHHKDVLFLLKELHLTTTLWREH